MIRVGCSGWATAQSRYFERLSTVEVNSSFYNLPGLATVERWRRDAPPDFVFSVKAWQLITHLKSSPTYQRSKVKMTDRELSRCGHFQDSDEVNFAWERTRAVVDALQARFVLLQTPPSFYPNANHLRDMYRFFKNLRRGGLNLVWEPRGESWEPKIVAKVCMDLNLIHGADPMISKPAWGAVFYYRLHGRHEGRKIVYGHSYSDAELRHLLSRCEGRAAYVYFNNISMWQDAQRFDRLAHPEIGPLAAKSMSHVRYLRSF